MTASGGGPLFLPGIPVEHVLARLREAGGNELDSGKLASAESSAALAINCFGRFIPRAGKFPGLPGMLGAGPAELVDVEFCTRFPWSGGRHPWLDATCKHRRPSSAWKASASNLSVTKSVGLADAYDRKVWGDNMGAFERMRDLLRSGEAQFECLDVVQLVKHAFGLLTIGRRRGLKPGLFYDYAEPEQRAAK